MTIDSDVLDSGLGTALANVIDDYDIGADANAAEFSTDNMTDLDIDSDTETFLNTYTATNADQWNAIYTAASSEDTTQPVQEAIRGFAYDVTANGLESQANYELVVNTAIKDSVSVSGSIEDAVVAYMDGTPVGLYLEKATGNFILSTTTPSATYYIPAGEYLAGAGKAVEALAIYETFKATVHDAYDATLGDEQAPFDAAKDYLVAASMAIAAGAVGGAMGDFSENKLLGAIGVGVGGALGGTAAETLTSDLSSIIHDAKVDGDTEAETLALVQAHIKSVVNDQWSATGATATDILDRAEDLATDLYSAVNGLAHGPDATYWPPAAPIPDPLSNALTPWGEAPLQTSPLVIDLSSGHTGITLTTFDAATTTTFYDLDRTGFAEQTAWVSGDTGLLVQQAEDGSISLFGTSTIDGFSELAKLDSNHDLKIDSSDADWSSLKVWLDANGDGVVQDGELHTLAGENIVSIDLAGVTPSSDTLDGNTISHSSTVTFTGGDTAAIDDVWLTHSTVNTYYNGDYTLDPDTLFLPDLRGYGTVADLTIAMSQDSTLKSDVADFVSGFSVDSLTDPSTLNSAVSNILYQWAGVEDVDPGSRGSYIDARQLDFLEHLFGQGFVQTADENVTDPWPHAAGLLDQSWDLTLASMKSFLELQSGFDLFGGTATYNPSTGSAQGDMTLDHTEVTDLVSHAPTAGAGNDAYWVEIATYIDNIKGIDNLTGTESGWLNDAVQATDSGLTWSNVVDLYDHANPGLSISGTSGADTLTGTSGDDVMSGLGGADVIHGGNGNDTIWANSSSDNTGSGGTLYGDDGNDILYGNSNNTFYGGNGDDTIYAGTGTNTIDGGAGGNQLYGYDGADTYVFAGGNDVIHENGGTDQILMPSGITLDDLTITRIATGDGTFDDLLITVASGGSIQIVNQFDLSTDAYQVETLVFSDSSTLDLTALTNLHYIGTNGDDTINVAGTGTTSGILEGFDGNDYLTADYLSGSGASFTLDGGNGNDVLTGSAGNDTYIASPGFDVINEYGGTDTIQIPTGYSIDDVTFSRHIGLYGPDNDLIIDIHGLGEIQIANQFYSSDYAVENLYFVDGSSTVSLADQTIQTIGTSGDDTLYGITSSVAGNWFDGRGGSDTIINGIGNNTYVFAAGFGTDSVSSTYHSGANVIDFVGVDPANIRMWTDAYGSLHLQDTTDPSHSITVSAATTGSGTGESDIGSYLQQINFDDSGHTTWDLTGGLTLTGDNSGDSLYGTSHGDTIIGGTGDDYIYGNGGNDTLVSNGGNDGLYGGTGNDTYVFSSGFGYATIGENTGEGTDTIHFSGINPADIRMWTDTYGDLYLQDTSDPSHYITVNAGVNPYTTESTVGQYVEQVTFDSAYSTTWDLTGGLHITGDSSGGNLFGTAYGDTMTGGSGVDYIYGNDGDDILYGAGGADNLTGGAGADTFLFKAATALGAVVTIADFNTSDGDKIDIADVLEGHYDPVHDAIANFVSLTTSGSDTLLKVDLDGTGGTYSPTTIATISGVTGLDLATLISDHHLIIPT